MRFFAHDGKTTHGPAVVDELLKLPGFDGDTLVCPVGSSDSNDWKPALAYPPFKRALLAAEAPAPVAAAPAPAPIPVLPPAPPMPALSPAPAPSAMPPAPSVLPPAPGFPSMSEPAPAPAASTAACPRCDAANPAKAAYCNACGAKMDARLETLSPAAPIATPAPAPGSDPFAPTDPFAAFDPMNAEPPMAAGPALPSAPPPTPAPSPASPMSRGPQPGGMGRLSELEDSPSLRPDPEPVSAPAVAPLPDDSHVLVTNPDAEPHAPPVPWFKRPPVLAGLAVAVLAIGGLGYYALLAPDPLPADPVAELNPSATPMDMPPAPAATPAPPPVAPTFTNTPAQPPSRASFPVLDKPARKKGSSLGSGSPAPKAKRPRRKRAPAVIVEPPSEPKVEPDFPSDGGGETIIESRAPEPKPKAAKKGKRAAAAGSGERDPLLESLLADATEGGTADPVGASSSEPGPPAGIENQPAPARSGPVIGQRPSAAADSAPIDPPGEPKSFSLPGLRRPVAATDRAAAVRAPAPPPRAPVRSADLAAILAEPGDPPADAAPADAAASDAPEGAAPEGDAAAKRSADGDQVALVQVHEQFDFCAQLLAQGAYGDHYDTCLCKDAREAAPYRGRRGFYVSALQKEAKGGRLETIAKISSSSLEGGAAKVVARWKSSPDGKGREVSQIWRLEDGLWCRAP